MTIGDVLAFTAGVAVTGGTLWAALVTNTLLFPEKTRSARAILMERPKKAFGLGGLLLVTAGAIGFAFIAQPGGGLLGLTGWLIILFLLALASIGSAGLALEVGERLRGVDTGKSSLAATGRAAALLVAVGFLPVLGWLGFFPASLAASLGAGAIAVFEKRTRTAMATVEPAPEAASEGIPG
jgi:hypothetical protein